MAMPLGNKVKYLQAAFLLLAAGCAQIVPPTGGPKDEKAPVVVKESPPNKSTNFRDKKISIRFDEFIQLKEPGEQIVMSPPVKEKPEYVVKGKTLEVRFLTPFTDQRTYTINFGNAIVDNHEGRSLEDYRYVFSPGPVLDSNKIQGSISDAFLLSPEKQSIAALYPWASFNDSFLYKTKPEYFSKSKEDGSFSIENIPADSFYLFAFDDENRDLKYSSNERGALFKNPVFPAENKNRELFLFRPSPYDKNRLVDSFSKARGLFCFVCYDPQGLEVKPKDPKLSYYKFLLPGKDLIDTLQVFITDPKKDSLVFDIRTPDTAYSVGLKTRKNAKVPELLVRAGKELNFEDT